MDLVKLSIDATNALQKRAFNLDDSDQGKSLVADLTGMVGGVGGAAASGALGDALDRSQARKLLESKGRAYNNTSKYLDNITNRIGTGAASLTPGSPVANYVAMMRSLVNKQRSQLDTASANQQRVNEQSSMFRRPTDGKHQRGNVLPTNFRSGTIAGGLLATPLVATLTRMLMDRSGNGGPNTEIAGNK